MKLMDVPSLKYGKQKNLIFDLKSGQEILKEDMNVSLMLSSKDIEGLCVEVDESYIAEQKLRCEVVSSLERWIQMKKFNTGGMEDQVNQLIDRVRMLPPTIYVQNILTDLEGQIREALNMTREGQRGDWFSKWGIHYLRSLRGAYMNENADKRVCYPNAWFGKALPYHDTTDLFPDDWHKI